jgi:hypothetical protein
LVLAVTVVAVALVLVTGGLIGSFTSRRTAEPTPPTIGDPTTVPAAAAPAGTDPASTTPSTNPSTNPGPAADPAEPVLSSLSPSTGVPGESVVVSGANFLSADGQIVARFGGQVAFTDCPAASSCTVTVPTAPGPASLPVTITTSAGTSNPLTFDYGAAPTTATPRSCRRAHPAERSKCTAPTGGRSRSHPGAGH